MNIRDSRFKKTIEDVIKTYLQKGMLPTSDEVINSTRNYLYKKELGLPFYEYQKIGKEFNIDKINETKTLVAEDISVASNTILSIYKDIASLVDKFENEKLKSEYSVNKLESEIISHLAKVAEVGYLESFREGFLDMTYIDAANTSATIDTETKECTLSIMNDKVIESIKNIELYSDDFIVNTGVSFDSQIKKVMNTPGEYAKVLVQTDFQKEVKLETIIDIGYVSEVSNIDIGMHLLKPGQASVYFSSDKASWDTVKDVNGVALSHHLSGLVNISIHEKCRYIKIVISKKEADKLSINNKYEYLYLYDYIKIFHTKYSSSSTLVSLPIEMDNIANEVCLHVEEETPAGCDIEYYITDDIDNQSPKWINILPINKTSGASIVLGSIAENRSATFKLDEELSEDTNKLSESSGVDIYLAGEIDYCDLYKYSLYKSLSSWNVKEVNINAKTIDNTTFIGVNANKKFKEIVGSRIYGVNKGTRDSYIAPTATRVSTNIILKEDMSIKKTVLSNFPVYIYLNGKLIYRTQGNNQRGEIKYDFIKGSNNLVILTNINPELAMTNQSTSVMYPILELGFDVRDIGQLGGDGSGMNEVSEYDLKYNQSITNAYAIRLNDDSTKWQILIKDDIYETYDFIYDYLINDNKKIKFKAVLRNNTNLNQITPKLNAFEIRLLK